MNIRGLGECQKEKIFHYYDIVFLQETHGTNRNNKIWKNEWGGDGYFANYISRSRGFAIPFENRNAIKINNINKCSDGRALLLDIMYNHQWRIYIDSCPVHAPPKGPDSFILTKFSKCNRLGSPRPPPPRDPRSPLWEILDPPLSYNFNTFKHVCTQF